MSEICNPDLTFFYAVGSMVFMDLSGDVSLLSLPFGQVVWSIGVFIHTAIFCGFLYYLACKRHFLKIVDCCGPGVYVTFVGIEVAAVASPMLGPQFVFASKIIFWLGFMSLIILFIPVSYSVLVRKPFPMMGSYGILIAPAALCYVAFFHSGFAGIAGLTAQFVLQLFLIVMLYSNFLLFLTKTPQMFSTLWENPNASLAGFTFPTTSFTIANLLFYKTFHNPPLVFAIICLILLILTSITQATVLVWFVWILLKCPEHCSTRNVKYSVAL
jgi:tellurite resistance protein TehA-like permease